MTADIILSELMKNRQYARKVLSHIVDSYFETNEHKKLYNCIRDYIIKYSNLPTINSLKLELSKDETISEDLFESLDNTLESISDYKDNFDLQWLFDNTEEWCKERALHNAILDSVQIIEEKKQTGAIPELIRQALQVQFDQSIGIEFMDNKGIDDRWETYQKKDIKFSTGIMPLDAVFAGGLETKSLTTILSGTHSGKTSNMIALGSNFLRNGHNVAYITLEMAEEKIAQRFDANFLDIDINDVPGLKESEFKKNVRKIKEKTDGKLFIKEYPPTAISANSIRALLEELRIKKDFKPDILIVDYLNLLRSDRVKNDNMYSYVKSIGEELRGLAVELEIAILTATQGNRATNDENCSDLDLTSVSESKGTGDVSDAVIGLITPIQLRENNQQIWKILKNRFGGIVNHKIPLRTNFARCQILEMDSREISIIDNTSENKFKLKNEENRIIKKNSFVTEDIEDNSNDDIWDTLGVK